MKKEKPFRYLKIGARVRVKIDDRDFNRVSKQSWRLIKRDSGRITIVTSRREGDRVFNVSLARFILRISDEQKAFLKDQSTKPDAFDYRRSNLAIGSHQQRVWSRAKKKPKSSIYKGVSFLSRVKQWRAAIQADGKSINLGNFLNEKEAARAYNKAAKKHFGKFAFMNKVR